MSEVRIKEADAARGGMEAAVVGGVAAVGFDFGPARREVANLAQGEIGAVVDKLGIRGIWEGSGGVRMHVELCAAGDDELLGRGWGGSC